MEVLAAAEPEQTPETPVAAPEVLAAQPDTLHQGQTEMVRLLTRNVTPHHRFDFGPCIQQVGSPRFFPTRKKAAVEVQVRLKASARCAPKRYPIALRYKGKREQSQAALLVSAAVPAAAALPEEVEAEQTVKPQLFSLDFLLEPAIWVQGEDYTVTLKGEGIDRLEKISFGPNITAGPRVTVDATTLRIPLHIDEISPIGARSVVLTISPEDAMTEEELEALQAAAAAMAAGETPPGGEEWAEQGGQIGKEEVWLSAQVVAPPSEETPEPEMETVVIPPGPKIRLLWPLSSQDPNPAPEGVIAPGETNVLPLLSDHDYFAWKATTAEQPEQFQLQITTKDGRVLAEIWQGAVLPNLSQHFCRPCGRNPSFFRGRKAFSSLETAEERSVLLRNPPVWHRRQVWWQECRCRPMEPGRSPLFKQRVMAPGRMKRSPIRWSPSTGRCGALPMGLWWPLQ